MLKSVVLFVFILAALIDSAAAASSLSQPSQSIDQHVDPSARAADRAASMFDEIVRWLAENFELPPTDSAPKVAFASQLDLMKLRAADRAQWQGFKYDDDPTNVRNVVAVYDTVATTIYLPLGWTGNSPGDQSVLVHEMVHHLQNIAKLKFECPAAREKVAYLAQDAWLRRFDLSLEDEFGVDMFTVVASSACM